MSRRKNYLLSVILLLLSSVTLFAETIQQDSVTLPINVVNGILDDLILLDAAKVELVKKDSIILIYKHMDNQKSLQITEYKLNEIEYREIITRLEELLAIERAKNKDLKKELRRTKIKAFLTTTGTVALGVLVVIIIL